MLKYCTLTDGNEQLVAGADEAAARDGRHFGQVERGDADDDAVRETDERAVHAEQREQHRAALRPPGRESDAGAEQQRDLVEQQAAASVIRQLALCCVLSRQRLTHE